MEIRGLGIINITHLFGMGAIRNEKRVQMVVHLEEWDSSKVYERLGNVEDKIDLLGVNVNYINVPIKPGRDVPLIIEIAAMNERLKKMGYHSAIEFNNNITRWLERKHAKSRYFAENKMINRKL